MSEIISNTLDYEESNMCKFNNCEYYDYDKQECCLGICKNLEK